MQIKKVITKELPLYKGEVLSASKNDLSVLGISEEEFKELAGAKIEHGNQIVMCQKKQLTDLNIRFY